MEKNVIILNGKILKRIDESMLTLSRPRTLSNTQNNQELNKQQLEENCRELDGEESFTRFEAETKKNSQYQFKWNHENTLLLLDAYENRVSQFRDPKVKKKSLWLDIAEEMNKYGYTIDADVLDKKMRNMRSTYCKILDNNKTKTTTGRGRINWEYFSRFEQIFATDKCIKPTNIVASMSTFSDTNNTTVVKETAKATSSCSSEPSSSVSTPTGNDKLRWKRLDVFRKRQLEFEEERVNEIKKIRELLEESNCIQRDKLVLFEKYLDTQRK